MQYAYPVQCIQQNGACLSSIPTWPTALLVTHRLIERIPIPHHAAALPLPLPLLREVVQAREPARAARVRGGRPGDAAAFPIALAIGVRQGAGGAAGQVVDGGGGEAAAHAERLGVGVAQAQQPGGDQQQRHEDEGAGLRHVAAEGGDEVHDQLGRGLQVPVEVRLGAQPRRRRDGLQVLRHAAQADVAALAQVHQVLGQQAGHVGLGRHRLRRLGALLDDPDVEEAGEHEGEQRRDAPPLAQQDHEDEGGDGQHGARQVQHVRDPAEVGALVGPDGGALAAAALPAGPVVALG